MTAKFLYRIIDNNPLIQVQSYYVLKETPCGHWINTGVHYDRNRKFVLSKTHSGVVTKKFAHLTIEEAVYSFYRRKKRQAEILQARANLAKDVLSEVDTDEKRAQLIGKLASQNSVGMLQFT